MLYYIIIVVLLVFIYRMAFGEKKKSSRKLTKEVKGKEDDFKRIDKRHQLEQLNKDRKILDLCIRVRLITRDKLSLLEKELRLSGVDNPIKYICEYISSCQLLTIAGVVIAIFMSISKTVTDIYALGLLSLLGIVMTLSGIVCFFMLPNVAGIRRREMLVRIDKDYPKILSHVYYYYGSGNNSLLLSEVMSKFNSPVDDATKLMVSNLIEDSKRSELEALDNMKTQYSTSIKIVNLADKLKRCSEGFELGPTYITSLYKQMVAEEDTKREQKEIKKNELYTMIMVVCMVTVLLLQVAGISFEMLKGSM